MADRQVRQQLAQAVVDRFVATGALDIPEGLREPSEAAARLLLRDEPEREAHNKFVEIRRNGAGIDPGLDRAERGLSGLERAVVEDGPSALTGEQLAALLVCPATLAGIGATLDHLDDEGNLPARWRAPTDVAGLGLPERGERAAGHTLTVVERETIREVVALAIESGTAIPALPADLRERLLTTLTSVISDLRLDAEYQNAFRAELLSQSGLPGARVPYAEVEYDIETLTQEGLAGASDALLYRLATQPHALDSVSEYVGEHIADGRAGAVWFETIAARGAQ